MGEPEHVFRVPNGVFDCGKRAVRLAGPKAQLRLARAGRVLAFAARGTPRELARPAAGELDPFTLLVRPAAVTWRTVGDSRQVQAPT